MIISRTPLRISLLGGGSDFPAHYIKYGGAALSLTIDKFIYAIVKRRLDDAIRITYTQTELVDHVEFVQHEIIREAMKRTSVEEGIEIVTVGDLPSGNGLSSSSAVAVGVLHALYALQNELPDARRLADDAIVIEVQSLKKPQGVQDQLAVAYGGLRLYEFGKAHRQTPIPHHNIADHLLLFHTGNTRKSESVLKTIRIAEKSPIFSELAELARIGAGYLLAGNVRAIGGLLSHAWELKKRTGSVSNGRIDRMAGVAYARGASGVKLCGAGGGGYLAVFCDDTDVKESVRQYLPNELPFNYCPYGSRVVYHE